MEIIIGKTSGFCAGVKNAVANAEKEIQKTNQKIHCLGELVHNKHVIQKLETEGLETIENIEQAERLRNSYLTISRNSAEELEEGRYYVVDLLGLEVYTDEQILLGTLEDIFNTGSNDIYVVKNEEGKQILLPAIQDVIKKIDIENKKVIVHLLPGLV